MLALTDVSTLMLKCHQNAGLASSGQLDFSALRELEIRAMKNATLNGREGREFFPNLPQPRDVCARAEILRPFADRKGNAERFGWRSNYRVKRECIRDQNEHLRAHARQHHVRLVELTVARNPEYHLSTCVSSELISYEMSARVHRKQEAGAPYRGFKCRKQTYIHGNIMEAILEGRHPTTSFFNNDTVISLTGYNGKRLSGYGAILTAFLGEGTKSLYYRSALLTGGPGTAVRGLPNTTETKREQDDLMRRLCFKPIEEWHTYPAEFSASDIVTRTYFYAPDERVCAWLETSRFILHMAFREREEKTCQQKRNRRTT